MKNAPIVAIATQAAASVNSSAIPTQNMLYCSVQAAFTGSAAGTLKLQVSNDNPVIGAGNVPVNWSDHPDANATVTVSGAGVVLIPIKELCYEWIRVTYANSGTGTIAAMVKIIGF